MEMSKNACANEEKEMSMSEKLLCYNITGPMDELPYPMVNVECSDGITQKEYVIPDEDKEKILDQLYLFYPRPNMNEVIFDLHEGKTFIAKDFKVIRWRDTNIIASPYHTKSGGMSVDWIPVNKQEIYINEMAIDPKFSKRMKFGKDVQEVNEF